MEEFPSISVLMTAYNREQYIAEAIESVLASTYKNFELIIVDDCSIDNTVDIARKYEAQDERISVYVNERNIGDYPNRNKAASYAKGKYIKYLDSDDRIDSDSLRKMVECMESYPKAGIGFTANESDGELSYPILYSPVESYRRYFFNNCLLNKGPSAAIIKKSIFDTFKGFKNGQYVGDTDLWLRIAQRQSVLLMEPQLVFWREHDQQQISFERRDRRIEKLRFDNIVTVLKDKNSPLSGIESDQIIRNIKNIKIRSIILNFLKGNLSTAFYRFKLMNFHFNDIYQAFKRNKKMIAE